MFERMKFRRLARAAAPGWADEAIALFGHNAEVVIGEQLKAHSYPARYSFQYCLSEIQKKRRRTGLTASLVERVVSAKKLRNRMGIADEIGL